MSKTIQKQPGTEPRMALTLKTADGRALCARPLGDGQTGFYVGHDEPAALVIAPAGERRVTLSLLGDGARLSAQPGGELRASRTTPDADGVFEVITEGDGRLALRLTDGQYLVSAPPDAQSVVKANTLTVGSAEQFSVGNLWVDGVDAQQPASHGGGCCGPRLSPAQDEAGKLVWERRTHSDIVAIAVDRMRRMQQPTPEARYVGNLWEWNQGLFRSQVNQGLEDADNKEPWKCGSTWAGHFYSPKTGQNWLYPAFWNLYPHAVKWGTEHFDEAVRLCRDGKPIESAYHLGLSLHFLTDLTQPMHAANFVNIYGVGLPPLGFERAFDLRHEAFEQYAERRMEEQYFRDYPAAFEPHQLALGDIESAEWYLKETAAWSYGVWESGLKDVARMVTNNTWPPEHTERFLRESLWRAPHCAGRYLAYWASRVMK